MPDILEIYENPQKTQETDDINNFQLKLDTLPTFLNIFSTFFLY